MHGDACMVHWLRGLRRALFPVETEIRVVTLQFFEIIELISTAPLEHRLETS